MTVTREFASTAHLTLSVAFPVGSTVTVVVTDHRRGRNGTHRTTATVLGVFDGEIGDWSHLVATVTRNGHTVTDGRYRRVVIAGGADARGAAQMLVGELARELHGSSTALRAAILN